MTTKEIAQLVSLLNKMLIELPEEDRVNVNQLLDIIEEDYEY